MDRWISPNWDVYKGIRAMKMDCACACGMASGGGSGV